VQFLGAVADPILDLVEMADLMWDKVVATVVLAELYLMVEVLADILILAANGQVLQVWVVLPLQVEVVHTAVAVLAYSASALAVSATGRAVVAVAPAALKMAVPMVVVLAPAARGPAVLFVLYGLAIYDHFLQLVFNVYILRLHLRLPDQHRLRLLV